MLQGLVLARCWFLKCYMCWCRDFLLNFSTGHLFSFATKPLWALDNPGLDSYPKPPVKPLGSQHPLQLKHIVFLYVENTHLLQGLNVFKEKSPIVWKVSGSSFLFNLEGWCLADTGKQTHIYEAPSQCPVKFAISLHDSQHYLSREHNPLGQETRAPSLLSSANRCVHAPQLWKSRPPVGKELQQLHICRAEKLSAKNRGGSHPPPPRLQSKLSICSSPDDTLMGWFNHSHMCACSQSFQNTRPVTASHLNCSQ